MEVFQRVQLKDLYIPPSGSNGEQNGQVTIIGGSSLFHGAPILALKTASRIVDMVFFSSPEPSIGKVAEQIKSKLMSFIWVPWEEIDAYIEKSDAVLIGPGLMRFTHEREDLKKEEINNVDGDHDGRMTREITKRLLTKFRSKKWVIDAGSLQTMDVDWIPPGAIITPNKKEMEILFKVKERDGKTIKEMAEKYNCIVVAKGPETIVASPDEIVIVKGGNAGLTKGGSGDVLAGLTVALLAKNEPFLSACAASFIEKEAADELYIKVGTNYNMDDLAEKIPDTLHELID